MYNTVFDFVCREPCLWVTMKKILMRPFPGKISTSNMPLKWRHETNEMVTNNTMMGWNNNSGEDNLSAKTIINCTMPTGTWLPPQCMKRLVLKIKLGTSIPTHRWRIKLVNMVNSFSHCSWITYKTQQVLKIKRYECTGLPRNSHFFVTYLLYKKILSFNSTKLAAELNILQ